MNPADLIIRSRDGRTYLALGAPARAWDLVAGDAAALTWAPPIVGAGLAPDPWRITADAIDAAPGGGWRVVIRAKHPPAVAEGMPADGVI